MQRDRIAEHRRLRRDAREPDALRAVPQRHDLAGVDVLREHHIRRCVDGIDGGELGFAGPEHCEPRIADLHDVMHGDEPGAPRGRTAMRPLVPRFRQRPAVQHAAAPEVHDLDLTVVLGASSQHDQPSAGIARDGGDLHAGDGRELLGDGAAIGVAQRAAIVAHPDDGRRHAGDEQLEGARGGQLAADPPAFDVDHAKCRASGRDLRLDPEMRTTGDHVHAIDPLVADQEARERCPAPRLPRCPPQLEHPAGLADEPDRVAVDDRREQRADRLGRAQAPPVDQPGIVDRDTGDEHMGAVCRRDHELATLGDQPRRGRLHVRQRAEQLADPVVIAAQRFHLVGARAPGAPQLGAQAIEPRVHRVLLGGRPGEEVLELAHRRHQVSCRGQLVDPGTAAQRIAPGVDLAAQLVELLALCGVEVAAIQRLARTLVAVEVAGGEGEPCLLERAGRCGAPAGRDPALRLAMQLARP